MGLSVDLAMSVISGVIKLGGRIDKVLAENRAVQADFVLPEFYNRNIANLDMSNAAVAIVTGIFSNNSRNEAVSIRTILSWQDDELEANAASVNSEISAQNLRSLLTLIGSEDLAPGAYVALVEQNENLKGIFGDWFFEHYVNPQNPNLALAQQLDQYRVNRRIALNDNDIYRTSMMISAGRVTQSSSAWRIAMASLDVFGELTLENQQSLIKDEKSRKIVSSVLTYFTKGDLENDVQTLDSLFKRVLSATLNGLLDTKDTWKGDEKWVTSLLEALADARSSVDESNQEDYLVGLLSGEGYNRLVGELIEEAGEYLESEDAGETKSFKTVVAKMLSKTAEYYREGPEGGDFKFVKQHWPDIARAGLKSFATHSEDLLSGNSELMKTILTSATTALGARTGDFNGEDLTVAAQAIIKAVGENPELIDDQTWMGTVFISFADTVQNVGLINTFTKTGIEQLTRTTLLAIVEHPQLIKDNGEFVTAFIRDLLSGLAATKTITAQSLGQVAIGTVLDVISTRPELVKPDSAITPVIGSFAAELGKLIDNSTLSRLQGEDILGAGVRAIAANPSLLIKAQNTVTLKLVDKILEVTNNHESRLLNGSGLTQLIATSLTLLASHGKRLIDPDTNDPVQTLLNNFAAVLTASLDEAARQLGNSIDLNTLPATIEELLTRWCRGTLSVDSFEGEAFADLFEQIAYIVADRIKLPQLS
ncbi:hypothetical protein [Alteromonas sp. 009811495]|uniref:hypothetical protein n=1 Tax=Alteromonas sp. 009811495 TaxID=3002962 RepID=UPI00237E9232|nr:hypothetical protein [Alteromonas sp. 009811495]WDT85121.1 hypothetical protein OZ660_14410 [Alteromonas sp. 009811495]